MCWIRSNEISHANTDQQHVFPLSQVYEGLLLKMGEKGNDGGQFFTPREVIRAMIKVIDPKAGETIYDPGCGTGGFLAQSFEYMTGPNNANIKSPDQLEQLTGVGSILPEAYFCKTRAVLGGLLLFLLRKGSAELDEPVPREWGVHDRAALVARLLCGAWEGWTELPAGRRGGRAVQAAVCEAMAQGHNALHGGRRAVDAPELPAEPPSAGEDPPQPTAAQAAPAPEEAPAAVDLRGWFREEHWHEPAALELCRSMGWGCIRTEIQLPQGSYQLEVQRGGARLLLQGQVEPQVTVDRPAFLALLAGAEIPGEVEAAINGLLELEVKA